MENASVVVTEKANYGPRATGSLPLCWVIDKNLARLMFDILLSIK